MLKFKCDYSYNEKSYSTTGTASKIVETELIETAEKIKVILQAKDSVTLKSAKIVYKHKFKNDEVFYAGGYQSWSTSKEYKRGEFQLGVSPIIPFKKFRKEAGASTDVWFCNDEKLPGVYHSHCYTYFKNHLDNGDVLFYGSVAEETGYTTYHINTHTNKLTIKKDVEGVVFAGEYILFEIVKKHGELNAILDDYFADLGVKQPKQSHISGYTSWYNYFKNINEDTMIRDLDALEKVKEHIDVFQIDDGYETEVGDWLDLNKEKFPNGMKHIADNILARGYKAGIWLAPFAVNARSKVFNEHKDWLIKGKNGAPLKFGNGWGGAYSLDIYNNEARAYIVEFFDTILNKWGYDMVKLDFLYCEAQLPRAGKSRAEIMFDAMKLLRFACGDKFILGCGVPLAPSFGLVDACRIGCDVNPYYANKLPHKIHLNDEFPSAQMTINNSIYREHLNGRAFICDPDVFFLRDINLDYTAEQKALLLAINHICGDVLLMSDNVADYSEETSELFKKVVAASHYKLTNIAREKSNYTLTLQDENGATETLTFNLKTGQGNATKIINKL